MKRLTLELGGKSPNIILDDADFSTAIPMAVAACYLNTVKLHRGFAPDRAGNRLGEVKRLTKAAVEKIKTGDPGTRCHPRPIGERKAYKRVQDYINQASRKCGARYRREGHPSGLESGIS